MLKVKAFAVFFILVCSSLNADAQTARLNDPTSLDPYAISDLWFFNSSEVMDFRFARNATLIVVCQVRSSAVVEGVKVYRDYPRRISGVKVFNLQVKQVIKGSGISPGSQIHVSILPWVRLKPAPIWQQPPPSSYEDATKWNPRKAFEELRKTGHLPAGAPPQEEAYPEIADGQEGIFRLFPASFEDPTGLIMWLGVEKLNQGKPLFGCSAFFPMDPKHQEVKVLQRYLEIGAIEDRQEQMRELAHFSLNLLKNPQTPEVIAIGASADAVAVWPDSISLPAIPALKKQRLQQSRDHLDDQGVNELAQIAADPSRSLYVRNNLMWAILPLVADVGRTVDLQPLFQVLENSQDDLDIRSRVIKTLGGLDNPEVRKKFEQILSKDTSACANKYSHSDICADKYVQDEIRNSKIMKQARSK
jgi:hypothetical protein